MSVPFAIRTDFTGLQLRALAKQSKDAAFARRLLAVAEIFDGGSRSDAARIGGVGLQTIRDWVLRFNAKGPEGLKDGKARGPTRPSQGRAPAARRWLRYSTEQVAKRPGKVSSTALVRFRINDYSAPTAYGFRDVLAKGFVDEVAHEVHSLGRLFGPNMRWVS